jgi:DHA2 family multidrug resistance protein-like MFS transporter
MNAKAVISVLIGVTISTCDISLTNTTLPTIARELGIAPAASIWIVNIYYLTVLAVLLPLGALGEIHGHRRVFLAGLVVFVIGSIASGLAWSLESLAVARAVLGLGAAAISAVTPALIRFLYPPQRLGQGLGIYAMVVGVALTAGPTLASAILSLGGWQAIFLINVPFGLFAAVLAFFFVPETTRNVRRFDFASAALCSGLFFFLLMALSTLSHRSDWRLVLASALIGIGCGYGLLRRERGHPAPILALDLFRIPLFSLSSATAISAFAIQGLVLIALPFLLQLSIGYSQVEAGFLLTPWPATLAIMTFIAGPLSDRVSPGLLGGVGLLVAASGLIALALLPPHASVLDVVWRQVLCGIGFGFFQSPNMKALMSSVPLNRSGGAGGILAASRLLGQSIGAALVAICLYLFGVPGLAIAIWLGAGLAVCGSAFSFLRMLPAVRGGS